MGKRGRGGRRGRRAEAAKGDGRGGRRAERTPGGERRAERARGGEPGGERRAESAGRGAQGGERRAGSAGRRAPGGERRERRAKAEKTQDRLGDAGAGARRGPGGTLGRHGRDRAGRRGKAVPVEKPARGFPILPVGGNGLKGARLRRRFAPLTPPPPTGGARVRPLDAARRRTPCCKFKTSRST